MKLLFDVTATSENVPVQVARLTWYFVAPLTAPQVTFMLVEEVLAAFTDVGVAGTGFADFALE